VRSSKPPAAEKPAQLHHTANPDILSLVSLETIRVRP